MLTPGAWLTDFLRSQRKICKTLGWARPSVAWSDPICDFTLQTLKRPDVAAELASERRQQVITCSRQKYATARSEVEAQLRAAITPNIGEPPVIPMRRRTVVPIAEGQRKPIDQATELAE